MNEYDEIQVSEWLRDGIAAAKSGRRDQAREVDFTEDALVAAKGIGRAVEAGGEVVPVSAST